MTLEEIKQNDIGAQLFGLTEGTDLDKKLDALFDDMQAKGLTEEQIFEQMVGGKENKDTLAAGEGIEIEGSQINVNSEIFKEFEKLMSEQGPGAEIEMFK